MSEDSNTIRNMIYTFIGIIISILTWALTIRQSEKESKAREREMFETRAYEYKPELAIDSIDTQFELYFLNPNFVPFYLKYSRIEKDTIFETLGATCVVNRYVRVKNVGQQDAYIEAYIAGDSITGDAFLRKYFSQLNDIDKFNFDKTYYIEWFLKSGSSFIINYKDTINFYTDSTFNLHLNILYRNINGNYYDYYYIHRYPKLDIVSSGNVFNTDMKYFRFLIPDLKSIDTATYFKVYKLEEVKKLEESWPTSSEN